MTPRSRIATLGAALAAIGVRAALGARVPATIADFHLPGTGRDPHSTWSGSLMAQAGRDRLFRAQMTTANQDVANVGYLCMRCHVPMSLVTGHVEGAGRRARCR